MQGLLRGSLADGYCVPAQAASASDRLLSSRFTSFLEMPPWRSLKQPPCVWRPFWAPSPAVSCFLGLHPNFGMFFLHKWYYLLAKNALLPMLPRRL